MHSVKIEFIQIWRFRILWAFPADFAAIASYFYAMQIFHLSGFLFQSLIFRYQVNKIK